MNSEKTRKVDSNSMKFMKSEATKNDMNYERNADEKEYRIAEALCITLQFLNKQC